MNPHSSLGGSTVIFVGGIHGVGKSFHCAKACERLGATHLVAGDLLKAEKQQSADTDKRVTSVGQNQDVLVRALERVLVPGRTYLLDGHFVLLNADGNITNIPSRTYETIAPTAVVLVVDDPAEISARLRQRDGRSYEPSFLQQLQDRELAHAREICFALEVPLLMVAPEAAVEEIEKIGNGFAD
jgi:adenylate kinase